ncbi:MAG: hypothetical protein ACR2GD_12865 [Pyrinomonadaceae bacterium]
MPDDSVKVIHGEVLVYASKEAASDGFDKHLKKMTDRGATILSRGTIKDSVYAYYRIDHFYGLCVAGGYSVVDYNARTMEDLQKFLK